MKKVRFSTKARTLANLYGKLKNAEILPVFYFTVQDYRADDLKIISDLQKLFSASKVIVRSSSLSEDGTKLSNAGHYKSILNVTLMNTAELQDAIEKVIESYSICKNKNLYDEILIQPMLNNVILAGVAFTSDIDTLAPYYVINFDKTGKTDGITNGCNGVNRTYIKYKNSNYLSEDKNINQIIIALKELENVFRSESIDVEFAINIDERLYIFQVRPITIADKEDLSDIDLKPLLFKIYSKIKKLNRHHPNLLGDKVMFGIMPDWNPAEIIGTKPKKLALTLYKELITDRTWAYQRDNYGYRALRPHPLLVSFFGMPFIDIRVDFNSFIPKALDNNTSEKLVNYYLDQLKKYPQYHDKVESKIVHSCCHFALKKSLKLMLNNGFNSDEIDNLENSLTELTNNIIHVQSGLYKKDIKKIEVLKKKYNDIISSDLAMFDKIYWLTENSKRYGTLPFAGIARAAFIAVQFLNSFVELEIITSNECNLFMNSLNTISKQLSHDFALLQQKLLSKTKFIKKYGHLRPGTYDITFPRYDENFYEYFRHNHSALKINSSGEQFDFSKEQLQRIDYELRNNNLKVTAEELLLFIKEAIEGREYSKLVFTRSLSKILQLIDELGTRFDIPKSDLAYIDFREILKLYSELDHRSVKEILNENITINKESYLFTKAIKLPTLIMKAEDIYGFYLYENDPNYVSQNAVEAEVVEEVDLIKKDPKGKIVFIKSADPGYDFLFTKGIAGLVTQYGGSNSHMAIRCAELGLPAVIGAGEKKFKKWLKNRILLLDCSSKKVIGVV